MPSSTCLEFARHQVNEHAPIAATHSDIQWAAHCVTTTLEHVSVDLRGPYVGMTEQLLDGTNVTATFE